MRHLSIMEVSMKDMRRKTGSNKLFNVETKKIIQRLNYAIKMDLKLNYDIVNDYSNQCSMFYLLSIYLLELTIILR